MKNVHCLRQHVQEYICFNFIHGIKNWREKYYPLWIPNHRWEVSILHEKKNKFKINIFLHVRGRKLKKTKRKNSKLCLFVSPQSGLENQSINQTTNKSSLSPCSFTFDEIMCVIEGQFDWWFLSLFRAPLLNFLFSLRRNLLS